MFLGHFGLAFASKKINQAPSLGTTFIAAQFVDLLWPVFLILGIEKVQIDPGNTAFTPLNFVSYPYTHSLLAGTIWAVVFALLYMAIKKDKKTAVLLAVLVISHWVLDFFMHRPDLPLAFGDSPKYGLGLWNNRLATIIIELAVFTAGVALYVNATKPTSKWGNVSLVSLIIFFAAIFFMNAFGAPPPHEDALGYVGLAQWLLVAWGYWTDANRVPSEYYEPENKLK